MALSNGLAQALGVFLGSNVDIKSSDKKPNFPVAGDTPTIPTEFRSENWFPLNSVDGLYEFAVINVSDGLNQTGLIVKAKFNAQAKQDEFTPFPLPLTPQEITQTEDFAVNLTPTQGGTVIQHSGNRYKTLSISGTTGVHPFKGVGGVDPQTHRAYGQQDKLKYRSGYEVFQHFRAWMKAYHESKARGGNNLTLRMVFRNYKDWEFLFVEPLKFTMKRDSSKPLLYNYSIQFKVLGHVPKPTPNQSKHLAFLSNTPAIANALVFAAGITLNKEENAKKLQAITKEIIDTNEKLAKFKSALKAIGSGDTGFTDIAVTTNTFAGSTAQKVVTQIQQILQQSISDPSPFELAGIPLPDNMESLLAEVKSLLQQAKQGRDLALEALEKYKKIEGLATKIPLSLLPEEVQKSITNTRLKALIDTNRIDLAKLRAQIEDIKNKVTNAISLGDDTYNTVFNKIATQSFDFQELSDSEFEIINALKNVSQGLDAILSSDEFFDLRQDTLTQISTSQNSADSIGGDVFPTLNPNQSSIDYTVPSGATLEDIALVELGDASRWIEIAELNGLKAPYISDFTQQTQINQTIRTNKFYDPTLISDLSIGYSFVISDQQTALNAWSGKENYITTYFGGTVTDSFNWNFRLPDDGMVVESILTGEILRYSSALDAWEVITLPDLNATNVAKPGDIIKIPSTTNTTQISLTSGPRDNPITTDLSSSEKFLAVDLRLNGSKDIALNAAKDDFELIKGISNGAQGVFLKLLYNKRSLKKYPSIGTAIGIGKKVPSLAQLREEIFTSLIQDERVEDVTKINIQRVNGTITISFDIIFKNIADPVPVNIPV